MIRRVALCVIACVVGLVLLNGCSTVPKMPIKLDPNFSSRNIDTIVLMPVVDRRIDKKSKIDVEKVIRIPAKRVLEKKGYTVVMPNSFNDAATITADNVSEMKTEDLSELGPKNGRALLFIYVDDILDDYILVAYSYKIEATGTLIDKKDRVEVWRDKGIGSSGQGGLMSGVLAGLYQSEATAMCLDDMLCTFPKSSVAKEAQSSGRITTPQAVSGEMANPVPMASPAVASPVSK